MKYIFSLVVALVALILPACGNSNNSESRQESDMVEVGDYDRSIQSYIPNPIKAFQSPSSLTTDDLELSGRLLLTPGGNLKGLETADGYQKVVSYTCTSIGGGWYMVNCKFKNQGTTDSWECYIREKI